MNNSFVAVYLINLRTSPLRSKYFLVTKSQNNYKSFRYEQIIFEA
jgi:hypothetical protein